MFLTSYTIWSLQIINQVERRHVGLTTFHGLFHSIRLCTTWKFFHVIRGKKNNYFANLRTFHFFLHTTMLQSQFWKSYGRTHWFRNRRTNIVQYWINNFHVYNSSIHHRCVSFSTSSPDVKTRVHGAGEYNNVSVA